MGVQIVISFYLVYLEFGLLDNMEVLSLVFFGIFRLSFIVAYQLTFPSTYIGVPFPTSPTVVILHVFNDSYSFTFFQPH